MDWLKELREKEQQKLETEKLNAERNNHDAIAAYKNIRYNAPNISQLQYFIMKKFLGM